MVTGAYLQTNLADEISTKVNLLPCWLGQERVTLLFFLLAEGMADGSLGVSVKAEGGLKRQRRYEILILEKS